MSQKERLIHIHWANALRAERKKQQLTPADLAHLLGMTSQSIEHYEAARRFPSRDVHSQLCELFPALRSLPTPIIRSYVKRPGRQSASARASEQAEPAPAPAPEPVIEQPPVREPDNSAVLTLSLMAQAGCTAQQVADVAAKLIERSQGTTR